jgi:hypothetical protein
MNGRFQPSERRVLAALRGPSGEVLRIIAVQPLRNGRLAHLLGRPIPVRRR